MKTAWRNRGSLAPTPTTSSSGCATMIAVAGAGCGSAASMNNCLSSGLGGVHVCRIFRSQLIPEAIGWDELFTARRVDVRPLARRHVFCHAGLAWLSTVMWLLVHLR